MTQRLAMLLLTAAAVVAAPSYAQDSAPDDLEPAVSGADLEAAGIEPAVAGADLEAAGDAEAEGAAALETGVVRRESATGVIDELDLGSTIVTGNQELPKVLYILPWKQSDLGDLVGRPVNSLLDEVLEPVDRDVFRRQAKYYETIYTPSPVDVAD